MAPDGDGPVGLVKLIVSRWGIGIGLYVSGLPDTWGQVWNPKPLEAELGREGIVADKSWSEGGDIGVGDWRCGKAGLRKKAWWLFGLKSFGMPLMAPMCPSSGAGAML